jgi:hypothetical protein
MFVTSWWLVTRCGVNGVVVDTNFFLVCFGGAEAWRVNSGSSYAGLWTSFRLELVGRVNSGAGGETSFLEAGASCFDTGRVYGVVVLDTNLFTVSRLELSSVLTLGKVNLGLV